MAGYIVSSNSSLSGTVEINQTTGMITFPKNDTSSSITYDVKYEDNGGCVSDIKSVVVPSCSSPRDCYTEVREVGFNIDINGIKNIPDGRHLISVENLMVDYKRAYFPGSNEITGTIFPKFNFYLQYNGMTSYTAGTTALHESVGVIEFYKYFEYKDGEYGINGWSESEIRDVECFVGDCEVYKFTSYGYNPYVYLEELGMSSRVYASDIDLGDNYINFTFKNFMNKNGYSSDVKNLSLYYTISLDDISGVLNHYADFY